MILQRRSARWWRRPWKRTRPTVYQSMREMVVDLRRLTRQRAQAQPQVASAPSHWRGAQEELRDAERAEIVNQLVEHRFTLGERVCRKLNWATLDPRIIGDHLHYMD